jgi:hypothetical protein
VLAILFCVATFVLHEATAGGYGYQRDELYFISCAQHLSWGYVDQPPLIALVAKIALALFGDSLYGIRLLPALAAAATVVVVGRIARRLGGGLFAQGLAMLAVALGPFELSVGNLLTMNAFEPLLWMGAAYLFMKAERGDRSRTWLALGIVVGLGLLNKYSMFFFGGSCVLAIALTPMRRALLRPGFFLALGVAGLCVAPTLWWQQAHGWPQLEVLHNAALAKNVVPSPLGFYLEQFLMTNPIAAPIWIAGLWFLFASRDGARLRWYGIAYVVLSVAYIALQAKVYYLAPIYPVLFAVGGVAVERGFARLAWARVAYPIAVGALGFFIAPNAFPLLPLHTFLQFEKIVDVRGIKQEKHPEGLVPQHFADMLGWPTLVATMSQQLDRLPPTERHEATIFTRDYGQAAAIDFLGRKAGLPHAISGHNQYFIYGTRGSTGRVVLALGLDPGLLRSEWGRVERVGTFHDDYLLPDQNDLAIYKCTEPLAPLAAWWPHVKRYI